MAGDLDDGLRFFQAVAACWRDRYHGETEWQCFRTSDPAFALHLEPQGINAADNDAVLLNAIPSYTAGPSSRSGGNGGHYPEAGDARNIMIRNVSVTGDSSVFTGPVKIVESKDGHTVSGISLENVTYFGEKAEFSR